MTIDLRDYIPAGEDEIREFDALVEETGGCVVPRRKTARFLARVEGARAMAALRRGERRVLSVGMLVDVLCRCFGRTAKSVGRDLSVGPELWGMLLAGKVEPDAIAPRTYAELARRFGVGFNLICDAVTGSHLLRRLGAPGASPRFAHSDRQRRRREVQSSLRDAYDELRLASSAHRGTAAPEERIEHFLDAVRECLR